MDNELRLPRGLMKHVDNSPRSGMCRHSQDDMGTMALHVLPEETLQQMRILSLRHKKETGHKIKLIEDAERATGRPHPLWDDRRKNMFRYSILFYSRRIHRIRGLILCPNLVQHYSIVARDLWSYFCLIGSRNCPEITLK